MTEMSSNQPAAPPLVPSAGTVGESDARGRDKMPSKEVVDLGDHAPDYAYVIFCRVVGLDPKLSPLERCKEIARCQKVLREQDQIANVFDRQSSVYGRIYFVLDPEEAIAAARSLLLAAARCGVQLAIGVAHGRIERSKDFGLESLAGPAISIAARLAHVPEAASQVLVDETICLKVQGPDVGDIFPMAMEQKTVKKSELNFRRLEIGSVSITSRPSDSTEYAVQDAYIVVFDIAGFSEKDVDGQWREVGNLRRRVLEVSVALSLQTRLKSQNLWYAPAGDGGVFAFLPAGNAAATAFGFAIALAKQALEFVNIRVAVATGLVVVVDKVLPVGTGIERADTCAGYPPSGGLCVDRLFWEKHVSKSEQADWNPSEVLKDPDVWVLKRTTASAKSETPPNPVPGVANAVLVFRYIAKRVQDTIHQNPRLRNELLGALKPTGVGVQTTQELVGWFFEAERKVVFKFIYEWLDTSEWPSARTAVADLIGALPQFGVELEYILESRTLIEQHRGMGARPVVSVPADSEAFQAQIYKAAIFDILADWSSSSIAENGIDLTSSVEGKDTTRRTGLEELREMIVAKFAKTGILSSGNLKRARERLEHLWDRKIPMHLLFAVDDSTADQIYDSADPFFRDVLLMKRDSSIREILANAHRAEFWIKDILERAAQARSTST